jgi:hypothetical protein
LRRAASLAGLLAHPFAFLGLTAAVAAVIAGAYLCQMIWPRHAGAPVAVATDSRASTPPPAAARAVVEARKETAEPAPAPARLVPDVRKEAPVAAPALARASKARDEDAASPTLVAPKPPAKPAIPRWDPELDSWFMKAYLACWTPPSPLPEGEPYAAQIRVRHKPDGSLAGAPKLVNPPSDPEWKPFAKSAVLAAKHCNLQVPEKYQHRYDEWRKLTLRFSPENASR